MSGAEPGPFPAGMPVYLSVADVLAARFADMPVGTRLPSEDKLAADVGVSRLTARAALAELENRYLVRRRQGSGTFVSRRIDYTIARHTPPSWSASVRNAGRTPNIRTTGWRLEKPPGEVRHRMRIGGRRQLLAVSRDRYVDGDLAGFADTWLDPELVPDLPQVLGAATSLYDALDEHYRLGSGSFSPPRNASSDSSIARSPSIQPRRPSPSVSDSRDTPRSSPSAAGPTRQSTTTGRSSSPFRGCAPTYSGSRSISTPVHDLPGQVPLQPGNGQASIHNAVAHAVEVDHGMPGVRNCDCYS